jgi:hypothetical protein
MKTDDLVSLLATGIRPVDRHVMRRAFVRAIVLGGAGALVLLTALYGVRPDIGQMLVTPVFWIKVALPFSLAVASFLVLKRLVVPGAGVGTRWAVPAVPVLIVWIGALAVLANAPDADRLRLILGLTWKSCPFNIALLSVPLFVAVTWAVRQMAPTRLRAAGAMAGLLASSVATVAYCLHCPEMEVPFWAIWYLAGMLIPALAGWLLGPRLLRW